MIEKIYAHVSCSSLEESTKWYSRLFGRNPDATPMQHLAEWHHGSEAGLQLFESAGNAGKSTLTLIVNELADEHARLVSTGLTPPAIESGDTVSILQMRDPDGNLVVLAQAGRA